METTWTIEQAAAALSLPVAQVHHWLAAGLLTAVAPAGSEGRLAPAEVLAWLDQHVDQVTDRLNQRDDHACFGCGHLNPFGLKLAFQPDGEGVMAHLTPGRLREGWSGTIHGGILATLLDEALAWALFRRQIWAVTARLNLTYRRPAPVGLPLTIHGWLVADRGRLIEAAGQIRDSAGQVLSEATAQFVRVREPERSRLERIYGVIDRSPTTDQASR